MNLEQALAERKKRETKGSPMFYRPFDKNTAKVLMDYYTKCLRIPVKGNGKRPFYTRNGTLFSTGYARVVVGHYGAYIEFRRSMLETPVEDKWIHPEGYTPSYWWMAPTKDTTTKVYLQNRRVLYADYEPGNYYVSPQEMFNSQGKAMSK